MTTATTRLKLISYLDKFKGQEAWVIGRGRTEFDYAKLAVLPTGQPVFFINDAVQLECHLREDTESFFIGTDPKQVAHFLQDTPMKSLPVIGDGSPLGPQGPLRGAAKDKLGRVLLYRKIGEPGVPKPDKREYQAGQGWLYHHAGGGTMSLALNFVWICGCSIVNFVGADGLNDSKKPAYDARLKNISESGPGWMYGSIRKAQDEICALLNLKTIYHGTPAR